MKKRTYTVTATSNAGFSLLETMIAMVVLTVGILAMMTMQTTAIGANANASSMTRASELAARIIEGYRSVPFARTPVPGNNPAAGDVCISDLPLTVGSIDPLTGLAALTNSPVANTDCFRDTETGFNVGINVQNAGPSNRARLITITVDRSYSDNNLTYTYLIPPDVIFNR